MSPDAAVVCYCCRRKGNRRRDLQTMEKDRSKKGKPVNAVEQAPGADADSTRAGTPARTSMVELDGWLLMMNTDEHETQERPGGAVYNIFTSGDVVSRSRLVRCVSARFVFGCPWGAPHAWVRGRRSGTAKRSAVAPSFFFLFETLPRTIRDSPSHHPAFDKAWRQVQKTQRHPLQGLGRSPTPPSAALCSPLRPLRLIQGDARAFGHTLATARAAGARPAPKCAHHFAAVLTWAVPVPVCLATCVLGTGQKHSLSVNWCRSPFSHTQHNVPNGLFCRVRSSCARSHATPGWPKSRLLWFLALSGSWGSVCFLWPGGFDHKEDARERQTVQRDFGGAQIRDLRKRRVEEKRVPQLSFTQVPVLANMTQSGR